jgi:hypothetical protein
MSLGEQLQQRPLLHLLARKDVLSGLLFMAVGALGLWLSRDYPVGTALRMGTGYVPRLLCWILIGLGVIVLLQGVRAAPSLRAPSIGAPGATWRPLVLVTASLVIFGLGIQRLGLVVSILLMVGVGALASRALKLWEIAAAMVVLVALSWSIFIVGLGLTIPVWPEW